MVTGASGGIGRAVACELAREGAQVLLTDVEPRGLEQTAGECRAHGARVERLALDLLSDRAADAVVDRCLDRFGAIDVLVNCAGRVWYRPLGELTEEDLTAQWELNVMVPFRLLRLALPLMAARGTGRVVIVSSVSAKQPSAANAAYGATKTAQVALVRAFAEAYASAGVVVNSVLPGPVDTPLWRRANAEIGLGRGLTADQIAGQTAAALPRGRVANECEIANVVVFLASPLAANVIGAAWTVDGGSARQLF